MCYSTKSKGEIMMDRRELLNELSKKYASETLEKYKECNYQYEEINKKSFFLHNSLIKNKFLVVMGISSFSFLIMNWFSVFSGNAIVSIISSVVPTIIVPSMLTGVTIGAWALLYKTVRSVLKLDKKAFEYTNAKSEEEKIATYYENKMEKSKLNNRSISLYKSYLKATSNLKLLYDLSIKSAKVDYSNQDNYDITLKLNESKEELDKLSIKESLYKSINLESADKLILSVLGMVPFIANLSVCGSFVSVPSTLTSLGVGAVFTGGFLLYNNIKLNNAIKMVLEKKGLTRNDLYESSDENINKVIKQIVNYEGTIYARKALDELNSYAEKENEALATSNKANNLNNVKVPDSVLEQFVEAPVVSDNDKVFTKTSKE